MIESGLYCSNLLSLADGMIGIRIKVSIGEKSDFDNFRYYKISFILVYHGVVIE